MPRPVERAKRPENPRVKMCLVATEDPVAPQTTPTHMYTPSTPAVVTVFTSCLQRTSNSVVHGSHEPMNTFEDGSGGGTG